MAQYSSSILRKGQLNSMPRIPDDFVKIDIYPRKFDELPCIVSVDLSDDNFSKQPEEEKNIENQYVVSAELGWIQFWHKLPLPKSTICSPEFRSVIYLGLNKIGKPAFTVEPAFYDLLRKVGKADQSQTYQLSVLQESIARGADAVFIFTHGDPTVGLLEREADKTKGVPASQFFDAFLKSAQNGHPLRFLYVMACDQREAFLKLLKDLASCNALHPDFLGVLMRGRPSNVMDLAFRQGFFDALMENKSPVSAMQAVHKGRLAITKAEHASIAESIVPFIIACHPHANPFPSPQERLLEAYWNKLRKFESPSVGAFAEFERDAVREL